MYACACMVVCLEDESMPYELIHSYAGVYDLRGRDVAQAVEHSGVEVWILLHGGTILHSECIFSLDYFPFQPVVYNWSTKGCGLCIKYS